jgi:hypothetical protein
VAVLSDDNAMLTVSQSNWTVDLDRQTSLGLDVGGGSFLSLYGVLHWSLSSAGEKGSNRYDKNLKFRACNEKPIEPILVLLDVEVQ